MMKKVFLTNLLSPYVHSYELHPTVALCDVYVCVVYVLLRSLVTASVFVHIYF